MDSYKKDFENALEMIDWQNKMLKQQADEIVKLKLEWQYMYDRANMEKTNEPVAWMSQGGDVSRSKDYFEEMGFKDLIPLYTHPAELTDEEIIEIGLKLRIATTEIEGNWSPVVLEFARAILRKAQEK